jgi:branched-chain amino acid transport system substrate-binding protein
MNKKCSEAKHMILAKTEVPRRAALGSIAGAGAAVFSGKTFAGDPIKVGLSTQLTGPLAASGKAAFLTAQIWAEEANKAGGLIGRPVELVYYNDQSNPGLVPVVVSKLLDVHKVDCCFQTRQTIPRRHAAGDSEEAADDSRVRPRSE